MTYDEALKIAQRAIEEAMRLHGQDFAKVYEEMRLRERQDPELERAMNIVGRFTQFSTRH
ncbi:Uncharacterised protein [Bordetella pertussis]|uniref:hypothetical protein n=1 Tax=Bordetella pertussis TaxID=520 RepID=UPI00030E2ECB|nr:hypothetical protein [Bordetella pertussis]AZR83416.1 hypothetical protein BBB37_00670 [Bordetella pertussis]PNO99489.1 hypothetical protein AL465_012400 [Bordetella pertussis 18323]UEB56848.1 hypothetical protein LK428_11740 [Bordetella pertussis]CFP44532.1 Uncharacterised protein [Bordetella pertussis]CFU78870.1 Uncharacterised protein [Bordetella pertussis]